MQTFGQLAIDLDSQDSKTFITDLELTPRNVTNNFKGDMITQSDIVGKKDSKDIDSYCRSIHSCYDCVKSELYPCGWCHDFGCTGKPHNLCPKTKDASNDNRHRGVSSCPYIQHDGDIFIPAGIRTNLKVKLHILDPIIYRKSIICQIRLKDRITQLKGFIVSNFVYCYPFIIDEIGLSKYTGTFKLIWGGVNPYSNEIPVSVYKCEKLAKSCGSCTSLRPEYGCGWCEDTHKCVVSDKCEGNIIKLIVNETSCFVHEVKLFHKYNRGGKNKTAKKII
ncbi:plexin-A3-like [Zerene cesonia]|uniref:plexin-A3-like n=1 Tax=Zerene cesonia TaxID=33412 RepID=UPI0018E51C62|nr:plexin-A3-like [Zerene cesonia]